jgi:RelA/SpoT family (p)ppGpp synthetase
MDTFFSLPSIDKKKLNRIGLSDVLGEIKRKGNTADITKIKKAYLFAQKAHRGQKRKSGHPFITHPTYVAYLAASLGLDESSITASFLHDVLEDTGVDLDEIERQFGLEVALIVEGMTAFKKTGRRLENLGESIDNFQKMLISSVDDIRVLIIRLSDKLHNALTIEYLPAKRQKQFAQGLLRIYAPLAEYVGLGFFKRELEDIAFSILYPEKYSWLKTILSNYEETREKRLKMISRRIKKALLKNKIKYKSIYGRRKGLWSLYQKMKRHVAQGRITWENPREILDQVGITIIAPNVPSCYAALGVVHRLYHYLPEEFDDYISSPKPNGYRSIQTTVRFGRSTAEIQIKTFKMHEYNEFGPASHIAYKAAGGKSVTNFSYSWVRQLVSWKNHQKRNRFKLKVFDQFVYVVTPKGDVIQLPKGSTPLDFAYYIHTRLGDYCRGALVNGKLVELSYTLENGDMVEILKAKRKIGPKADWLDLVKTGLAKRIIRRRLGERYV